MLRNVVFGLVPLVIAGCGPASGDVGEREGIAAAFAAERPWRFESPPADTVDTVTRRVWYGPLVDPLVSPTPDGKRLAHTDWTTGDMAVHDLTTHESRHLTHNTAPYTPGFGLFPRVSPEGGRIAYTWWRQEKPYEWQLQVVDMSGSEPRVVQAVDPWIHPEDWSSDGKRLLALRALPDGIGQIVLVSVDDGSLTVLKTLDWRGPQRMTFSPDGRWILYDFPQTEDSQDRDLYVLAADGSREIHLIEHPANDVVLGWAPDGEHILFASDRTGTPGAWLLRVAEGTAQGTPMLVKPDFWQGVPIGFTPDGSFFYGVHTATPQIYLATLDLETGKIAAPPVSATPRALGSRRSPSWSPDGRYLAYIIRANPGPEVRPRLAVRSLETGEEREVRLPVDLKYASALEWLPDGHSLLLLSQDNKMRSGLYRVDIQTGRTEALFHQPMIGINLFGLVRGGQLVIYVNDRKTEDGQAEYRILLRDLANGDERELYRLPPGEGQQIRSLAVSPDGATVAFQAWRSMEPSPLMLLPVSGGEPRELIRDHIGSVVWTRDGHALLYTRPEDLSDLSNLTSHVWRVSVRGGKPEPMGLSMPALSGLRISPDGRRLAFVAGIQAAEVWVMENFLPAQKAAGASSIPR